MISVQKLMLATIPSSKIIACGSLCLLAIVGSIDIGRSQVKPPNTSAAKSATPKAPQSSPAKTTSTPTLDLAKDTKIVPGRKIGAIDSRTTYADLIKIYGKQRLAYKKVYGAEGQTAYPGTVITFGKAQYLTVAWRDDRRTQPLYVIVNDPRYQTESGIGLGTSLDRLRQILGEFKITGLYWDYGNTVINLSPTMQKRYQGLIIHVDADRAAAKQYPRQLRAVTGDGVTPASNNPVWKPLKMRVSGLTVSLR